MEDRQKVIETIRKLSALANPENGAFENEIAVASSKMQKLMDEHNVTLAEVMNDTNAPQDKFGYMSSNSIIGSFKRWHWGLGRVIARITMTRHYGTRAFGRTLRNPNGKPTEGNKMAFFGDESSVQIACDLYDTWVVLIDDMAKKYTSDYVQMLKIEYADEMEFQGVKDVRHLTGLDSDHPNVWRESWLLGVITGITLALDEQEKNRDANTSNAIVLVSQKLSIEYAQFSRNFSNKKSSGSSINSSAYASGKRVGATLDISGSRSRKRIGG